MSAYIDFPHGLTYTHTMSMNAMPSASLQQILQELRVGLIQLYGSRLKSLVLFGSYARGQADEGSDIDVALILDDFAFASTEIERCIEFVAALSLQYDCVISIIPIRERDWLIRQTPFLMNVRREAIPVS